MVCVFKHISVVVTESLIRAQLQLDDANGIFDMQIDDIFAGMGAIGYPPGRTLTFLKHQVHTILHCLSPKAGSWNQFPSSIATALIFLSTGRVYNFSRFILEGMIANVKTKKNKFLMYPRFLQMLVAIETADRTPRPTFGFTRKLFSNMKFKWEGEEIPLTPPMLAIAAAGNDAADDDDAAHEDNAAADEEPQRKSWGGAILTLVSRVKKLERTVKQLKTARFVGDAPATEGDVNIQDDVDLEGLLRMASEIILEYNYNSLITLITSINNNQQILSLSAETRT
ncbi:hypothetical protein Tco_0043450 [Tanacetum coccineum]